MLELITLQDAIATAIRTYADASKSARRGLNAEMTDADLDLVVDQLAIANQERDRAVLAAINQYVSMVSGMRLEPDRSY